MMFDTYGPFHVRVANGAVPRSQPEFWEEVENSAGYYGYNAGELSAAIGCYSLVSFSHNRYKPWYVGMTVAQGGFKDEIFHDHKLKHYKAHVQEKRGSLWMFLFPLLTNSKNFSKARTSAKEPIEWLERTLIGMALAKNPELRNLRSTKYLKTIRVNGIIGQQDKGRPKDYAIEAKKAFLK